MCIGLFCLAGVYVAIGVFSSSLTGNQIVSFIIAVVLCFIMYIGFDSISAIPILQFADHIIVRMGINEHYKALSRGVIDSRDIVYYIGIIFVFIFLTKFFLQNRK